MILATITFLWVVLALLILFSIAFAVGYIVTLIETNKEEAKKRKENELSLINHNWKGFKNKPWYEKNNL